MPESEFDKQVQQELEGLRMRPSTAVWENVEKELRQKKRRRVIIAFWMIAGIVLLGSTTYFLSSRGEKAVAETSLSATKQRTGSAESAPATTGVQTPVQTSSENVAATPDENANANNNVTTGAATTGAENSTVAIKEPVSKETSPATQKTANGLSTSNKLNGTTVKKQDQSNEKQQPTASVTNNKKGARGKKASAEQIETAIVNGKTKRPVNTSVENSTATSTQENLRDISDTGKQDISATAGNELQNDVVQTTPAADSVQAQTDSVLATVPVNELEAPAKGPEKKADRKKIKWSLDLAIGGSGPIKSPFLVGANKNSLANDNVQYSPVQGGGLWQPVNQGGNAFAPVFSPRSDIRPGLSYRAGLLVELPVSDRVSFSSGLQYQYQSNNIRIGNYVNTQLTFNNFASQQVRANGVYQGVQMKTFTNRYHYLQVPLLLNWQMNKGKKLPVILNTGFSAGYLVSTNALTYDTLQGGTYYHDGNAFKRFQFSFTTGVSFRFGNNRALQWSIGPEASMGLRRTVKTEYDTRQYPVYIGLQGRIYLPTKKK